jgi:predicted DNA-binding protein with PD1-like motif
MLREYKIKPAIYQGSLNKGDELIKGLTFVLKENKIASGIISGIGAVSQARIGYFNAQTKKYEDITLKESLEILSINGNVSMKDGEIFAHLHVVFSGKDSKAFGGHLFDAVVYVFEFNVLPLEGKPYVRKYDDDTGLFIWQE